MSILADSRSRLRFERLSIGGFSLVELQDGHLSVREFGFDSYEDVRTPVIPPPERWIAFWKEVDSLGMWGWKPDYDQAALDGWSWTLELEHGGRRLSSRGSNA